MVSQHQGQCFLGGIYQFLVPKARDIIDQVWGPEILWGPYKMGNWVRDPVIKLESPIVNTLCV